MVYAVYNGRSRRILGRSGDKNLLSAGIQVSLRLLGRSIESGALENKLYAVVCNPRNITGIALRINLVFFSVNDNGIVSRINVYKAAVETLETAVSAVVFEKISKH